MSTNEPPMSPKGRVICGVFAAGMGLLLMLVGLGMVPVEPQSGDSPMWIVTTAGLAFLLAGISIVFGAMAGVSQSGELPANTNWWARLFYYGTGLAIVGALAIIGSWIAFGPGERSFSGPGMLLLSKAANDLFGRIVFGAGAVVTWLFLLALGISGARKLFSRNKAD